ncbi:MAG: sigma 54-interacting transcriptional regulator [Polyangiaceae bacterium]|nr:sigma 54-interacting transcriptional regulator [Polyangiaceae bacterium]
MSSSAGRRRVELVVLTAHPERDLAIAKDLTNWAASARLACRVAAITKDAVVLEGGGSTRLRLQALAELPDALGLSTAFPIFAVAGDAPPGDVSDLTRLRRRLVSDTEHLPFSVVPLSSLPGGGPVSRRAPIDLNPDRRSSVSSRLQGEGPLLLLGPTGVGKSETARLIHHLTRPAGPFRQVNCAGLLDSEREVFFRGVVKNRFTGVGESQSVFETLDGGTLFLDEFQELEPGRQAQLLDLLDPFQNAVTGYRIGAKDEWKANVQVLLAINEPLQSLISQGRLRRDLYSRVRRIHELPTLHQMLAGDPESEGFLRMLLIGMQERCFSLHSTSDPHDLLGYLGCIADPSGAPLRFDHEPLEQRAPVPLELLTCAWPANFRDVEQVARNTFFQTQKVASWLVGDVQRELDALSQRYLFSGSSSPAVPEQIRDLHPARLIGLAYISALSHPQASISRCAAALKIDRRTLKEALKQIGSQLWFQELNPEERIEVAHLAQTVLDSSTRK